MGITLRKGKKVITVGGTLEDVEEYLRKGWVLWGKHSREEYERMKRKIEEMRKRRGKAYIITYKREKVPLIDEKALEKAREIYLSNVKKSIYDQSNISTLKAWGWSDEKIREWQRKEWEEALRRVSDPNELRKIAEGLAKRGYIKVKFAETRIAVKRPVLNKRKIEIMRRMRHPVRRPELMLKRAKQNLKSPVPVRTAAVTSVKPTPAKPKEQPKRFDLKKVAFLTLGAFIALKILKR
ncbi:hypothetical protein [Thermococcus barophilus]|uniref:Uncharacterized protein n=1 Tax=Thermococcus barophilus TaxID=55802 RepID=A0A0S1XFA9_THEBA|nr:hypothetical protein [Thermococcus barophilus]ALM76468.1 hypothetical protein TBCH5v1_2579 [Thermococcus barophilus]